MDGIMLSSPPRPVELLRAPNGDVYLMPVILPLRLTPDDQRWLAEQLLEGLQEAT